MVDDRIIGAAAMIKIENAEDRQLPRWVYAMMKANEDPNAEDYDSPKLHLAKLKAEEFYSKRKERLATRADSDATAGSRVSGLEWKSRPKNTFSSDELDRIMPTRRASYVANRAAFLTVVGSLALAATLVTVFIGMAVCAELKLSISASAAWAMFTASPTAYYHHVMNAFDW